MSGPFESLIDQLAGGVDWPDERPCLAASWADPVGFGRALARFDAPRQRDLPDGPFDLFHGLVHRHAAGAGLALRSHDPRSGWHSLTYAELDLAARRRAARWSGQGLTAKSAVVLALPIGDEWLISLAAALYLGACLTILEPGPPARLGRRIARLAERAPCFVAAAPELALTPPARGLSLGESDRDALAPPSGSRAYAGDEAVACLCSPLLEPGPLPLTAGAAYRGALRDGLLAFSLRPGDLLAAPGFPLEQHQPALVFATLLAGATLVQVELAALTEDATLLSGLTLRGLGVSRAARDALRAPGSLSVQHWFRDPLEPLDLDAWLAFVKRHRLEDVRTSTVVIDASAGGVTLRLARPAGHVDTMIAPVAGRPWTLVEPSPLPEPPPARGPAGLLVLDAAHPPSIIVGRAGDDWLVAGTLGPRRAGRLYPAGEVTACLAALDFVEGASIVPLPGRLPLATDFALVVFTASDHPATLTATHTAAVLATITDQIGADHLPDRVLFFPLHARRRHDGAVDDAWCRDQLLSGALDRKQRSPLFAQLTRLRERVAHA
jgi:hypothetical protein